MNKIDTYTLDNGLKVVLYNDNSKHCILASLFVKFGGNNKEIIIDNKKYPIKDGTAHFMEHLLYEHSIYGEMRNLFLKNHTYSNASTNKDYTRYYINSVNNFGDDLIKLINIVNKPSFTKENIEEVRSAIIKEKMMSKDNKFERLNKLGYDCLFKNIKYPNVLGEIKDINSICYDDIKVYYDTFYNPCNQTLCIAGNFNIEEVKEIINDTYSSLNNKYITYELPQVHEKDAVNIKESSIYEDTSMNYVRVSYKININTLTPYEKVKLSFYMPYFIEHMLGFDSNLYHKLVKEQVCQFDIDIGENIINDYLIIHIGTFTDNKDQFTTNIINAINKKEFDEEDFELRKKDSIIRIILREDNMLNLLMPLLDNILIYGYYYFDTVEDIESYTFEDFKNTINSLDFSNYCITEMIKETD